MKQYYSSSTTDYLITSLEYQAFMKTYCIAIDQIEYRRRCFLKNTIHGTIKLMSAVEIQLQFPFVRIFRKVSWNAAATLVSSFIQRKTNLGQNYTN